MIRYIVDGYATLLLPVLYKDIMSYEYHVDTSSNVFMDSNI